MRITRDSSPVNHNRTRRGQIQRPCLPGDDKNQGHYLGCKKPHFREDRPTYLWPTDVQRDL